MIQDPLFNYGLPKESAKSNTTVTEPIILALTIILICFSLVMVYSTTGVVSLEKFHDPYYYVKRQAFASIIGFGLLFLCSRAPLELYRKITPYFFVISLGMLLATYVPGIGDRAGGAQRWLNLGIVRFQPGEFVKLFFILFIAGYLARNENKLSEFVIGIVKPFAFVACVCALFLKQPDFGSSAIICIITLVLIGSSGARIKYLGLMGLSLLTGGAILVILSPYRMKRVTSFLQPWADPSGSGYQLIQSLIAVGSGNITGVGLGSGQQKLFYLPAAHTDFIFAVVGEELGMVGCMVLLSLFLLFLARGIILAGRVADDTFAFCVTLGTTLLVVVPALLNAGVVTGMLPTKGMVLPLVGYGGSSIMASLMGIGVLLSVARWHGTKR